MDFDFSPVTDNWRYLAGGLGITLLLSVLTVACSMMAGTLIALGRMYGPAWLRTILTFYIDFAAGDPRARRTCLDLFCLAGVDRRQLSAFLGRTSGADLAHLGLCRRDRAGRHKLECGPGRRRRGWSLACRRGRF